MEIVFAGGKLQRFSALGFNFTRKDYGTQTVEASRGWFPLVREPFAGAWQRNVVGRTEDLLAFAAVFQCARLICSDIGKVRITLVENDGNGIWTETDSPSYSPVLRKPNHYQNRIEFVEQWQASRLLRGNTYVLKERDKRGVVVAQYILDADRVRVMVAANGEVFYALSTDNLAGLQNAVVVPASEIIHDKYWAPFHPLCGITPITACALAAGQGLRVQKQSELFFANGAMPSGILTTPQDLDPEQQKELQDAWESQYTGNNAGRVAVLGFEMKFEKLTMSATDAQLIEQLRWTGENICTAFGVPAYMVGVGPPPNYNNIEALNQQYYTQTLQNPIEKMELCLDEGLGLLKHGERQVLGVEFDLDDLIRMDTPNKIKAASEATKAGMSINEARKRYMGLGPVKGGDVPFLQQQNFPITVLAERTSVEEVPAPPPKPTPTPDGDEQRLIEEWRAKSAALLVA